jgi:hypothetical protein
MAKRVWTERGFRTRVLRALTVLVAGGVCMMGNAGMARAAVPIGGGSTVYMFVANPAIGAGSVTMYRLPFAGDTAPLTTIEGTETGLSWPDGVAVNGARDLYVANGSTSSRVLEFAPGANGNVSPIGSIQGSKTQLFDPVGIAIDGSGDIWVFNFGGTITEYPPGSTGNVAPEHEINVWDPQYSCGMVSNLPQSIAIDTSGNLWVDCGSMVLEYAPGATNGADPEAVITGRQTGLASIPDYCCGYAGGLVVDGSGNIFVANEGTSAQAPSITSYAPGSSGDVEPTSKISGPATDLPGDPGEPGWNAGELYLAGGSSSGPAVDEYPAGASGDIAPTDVLSGSATGLNDPSALAFVTIRSGEYCPGGCVA